MHFFPFFRLNIFSRPFRSANRKSGVALSLNVRYRFVYVYVYVWWLVQYFGHSNFLALDLFSYRRPGWTHQYNNRMNWTWWAFEFCVQYVFMFSFVALCLCHKKDNGPQELTHWYDGTTITHNQCVGESKFFRLSFGIVVTYFGYEWRRCHSIGLQSE